MQIRYDSLPRHLKLPSGHTAGVLPTRGSSSEPSLPNSSKEKPGDSRQHGGGKELLCSVVTIEPLRCTSSSVRHPQEMKGPVGCQHSPCLPASMAELATVGVHSRLWALGVSEKRQLQGQYVLWLLGEQTSFSYFWVPGALGCLQPHRKSQNMVDAVLM